MAISVFAAVLLAALLHASWNLLVKINLDRFLAITLIHVLMGVIGLGMLAFTGLPKAGALPYGLVSAGLHTSYNVLLARSYKTGEMSVVYPVARGTAPAITLLLSVIFAQDDLTGRELLGLGILIAGLLLIGFSRSAHLATDRRTLMFALGTALFIGLYTVVDGLGARASGNALTYSGYIFFLDGLYMLIAGLTLRGPGIARQLLPFFWRGALGSAFSAVAYGLVIWAMTVEKIGPVAALRETSILFVLVMSRFILKEELTALRVAGGLLIMAGAAGLRFS